jgi:HAD superfamily hydrolase (TIGR01509 family)
MQKAGIMRALDPALVIFDCDGVLIDSEAIASAIDARELSRLGLPMTPAEAVRRFAGVSSRDMRGMVEGELGSSLPEDFERRIETALVRAFKTKLKPIEGVRDVVTSLGVPVCVASSSSPDKLGLGLSVTGLFGLFYPHIFSSVLVRNGKPAPDLFLFAADRLGVPAERCVVVEDSTAGVKAAKAAGMVAIGFVGGSHCGAGHAEALRSAGADQIIGRFADLLDAG